jgi:hypothetical protein
LIAEAVEREVPVLVAVPWGNLDRWRRFAGDLAVEYELENLPPNRGSLFRHLGLVGDGDDVIATTHETPGNLRGGAEAGSGRPSVKPRLPNAEI